MPLSSVTAAVMYQLVVRKRPCAPSTTMVNSPLGTISCGSKLAVPSSFRITVPPPCKLSTMVSI